MMSTRLDYFLSHTLKLQSVATILSSSRGEDGRLALILDSTIFHPQGGGQPADTGCIASSASPDLKFIVQDVRSKDGVVHHYGHVENSDDDGKFASVFEKGQQVFLQVDESRRILNSRFWIQLCAKISTIYANVNSIPMFSGTNFKDWKENIEIVLSCMGLDYALWYERPTSLTDVSSSDDRKNFEKWDHSNRISLIIIKRNIPEAFKGVVSDDITTSKEFLVEIEKCFAKNNKAETGKLLQNLISMKYKDKGNIKDYIMEMSHIAYKLKKLKLELSDDLLVHLVLISLPVQYGQFKVSYNCQKEKWTLNELISYCVREEERLKQDKAEGAYLAVTHKNKGKRRMNIEAANSPLQKKQQQDGELFLL